MHFTFKLRDQLEGNCPSTYNKGGGGSSTTVSGIPDEFKPYIEEGLKTAEGMYKSEMAAGSQPTIDAYTKLGTTGAALGAEAAAERANLAQFKTEGAGAQTARDEYNRQMGQDWNQMIQQDLQKNCSKRRNGHVWFRFIRICSCSNGATRCISRSCYAITCSRKRS